MTRLERAYWWRTAVLVGLPFVAYGPALGGPFLWDDLGVVVWNPLLGSVAGLRAMWFSSAIWDYWPLTYTTFWVERRVWGDWTLPYHLVNVGLHAGAAFLLWRALVRLEVPGAWAGALLFAVHPVNTEAVAWITQRKTVLSGVLALGALLCYVRHERRGGGGWYAAAVLLFVGSLLSKTSSVMLPVVLLVLGWWRRGRIGWRDVVRALPFFAAAGVAGLVGIWFQWHRAIADSPTVAMSAVERVATAGRAVWFYLYKAVWPTDLAVLYPRWSVDVGWAWAVAPWVGLLAIGGVLVGMRRVWGRGPAAALACFVVVLFPVLGFFGMAFQRYALVSDHWQYLAVPVVTALVAGVGARFGGRAARVVLVVVVVGFVVLSWRQARLYADRVTFWAAAVRKNPAAQIAQGNYAQALVDEGHAAAALAHLRDVQRRYPNDADANYNLGVLLREAGAPAEARGYLERAAALAPDEAAAFRELGQVRLDLGEGEGAVEAFGEAARLAPRNPSIAVDFAKALASVGRYTEAAEAAEAGAAAARQRRWSERASEIAGLAREYRGRAGGASEKAPLTRPTTRAGRQP
jgi:hypothetical protein